MKTANVQVFSSKRLALIFPLEDGRVLIRNQAA